MADSSEKFPENIPGDYYVDENCVFCGTCIELAPDNVASKNGDYAYVQKQPENPEEEDACEEAGVDKARERILVDMAARRTLET